MHVLKSTKVKICICGDKERVDEISTCTVEDSFYLLYQLSCNPVSDLGAAENFIMDPVEAEKYRRRSLRNTECA